MEIFFSGEDLASVAVKALLLYLTAVLAFRISRRRTVAEMSPFDFIAAVAVGAIVGRVPNSGSTSYVAGAITLLTILLLHAIITFLRRYPNLSRLVDHPPRLLFAHGKILERELFLSGLTKKDLQALLRQKGVTDLDQLDFVIYEQKGRISVVRTAGDSGQRGLVDEIVKESHQQ